MRFIVEYAPGKPVRETTVKYGFDFMPYFDRTFTFEPTPVKSEPETDRLNNTLDKLDAVITDARLGGDYGTALRAIETQARLRGLNV